MKQTEYLNGVLKYYHENDVISGDPNEGRWEDAHTPYPRGMADDTVPLLHKHHVIHDLWQSKELDKCHFFAPNVKKVLYAPNFWPSGWFDLCNICDYYYQQLHCAAVKAASESPKAIEARKRNAKRIGDLTGDIKRRGAFAAASRVYQCLVTGFESSGQGLTRYQKNRGIDTKLRKRIK